MKDTLEKIKKLVYECGNIILKADRNSLDIEDKEGIGNIVTKYDKLVQDKLKNELLKIIPEASFMGEEDYKKEMIDSDYIFVVDPIDGTMNFSRDMKTSAISVALLKNGEPIIGVCYNPYSNEMYSSIKNNGAYLNDKPIKVSNKTLKDGIVLCGSAPYYTELREKTIDIQNKLFRVASDYRRFGAAVLDICYIASGKAEMFFELKLMPWDFAAASLILKEAGGKITTIDGSNINYMKSISILATNNKENYLKYIETISK